MVLVVFVIIADISSDFFAELSHPDTHKNDNRLFQSLSRTAPLQKFCMEKVKKKHFRVFVCMCKVSNTVMKKLKLSCI